MHRANARTDATPDSGPDAPVIVFDGVCALCNQWVRFLLRFDHRIGYRFAAMQGSHGRALLAQHGLNPDDPSSFLLIQDGRAWTDTDAILRVLQGLGGGWRALGVLRVIPAGLRDRAYLALARNRYRWFGRHDQCYLPDPAQAARFLD